MSTRIWRGVCDPSGTGCKARLRCSNPVLTIFIRLLPRLPQIAIAILLLLVLNTDSRAQQSTTSITDGTTPSGMAPGSPAGSIALSGFENINLFNGNLNFRLPLLGVGGRGGAGYSMTLARNLKGWHVSHFHKVMPDENEINSYKPTQTGWRPYSGYGAGQLSGRHYGLQVSTTVPGGVRYYNKTLGRFTFSAADGTEYELRDQLTDGQPLNSTQTQGAYRGTVFVTADGTAATYISDTPIYDNPQININGPRGFAASDLSGYLMLRDGTRYRIDGGNITWISDRNGNKVSFTYDANGRITVTDSLGRQVTIDHDVDEGAPYGLCDKITFSGFGGAQRIIRVSKTNLENALRPNSGYSTKFLGGATGLFPELNGASTTTLYNPQVTSAVWLPDGVRSYKLYYNSYGEIARVELPTGGAYEYDMTPGSGVVCAYGPCTSPDDGPQIYRRVVERRVYPDGSTGALFEQRTNYTNSEAVGVNTSTITEQHSSQNGTVLSRSRHTFDGSALDSLFVGVSSPYTKWYEGREKQTELLDTSGPIETATVLRRIVNTWAQRTFVSWLAQYPTWDPPKDPRLIETVTTVEPNAANLVSKRTSINPQDPNIIGFDQYNNQTDMWEFGFGTGTPGEFLRRTHTDFLTTSSYVNADVNPSLGAHLRSLPVQHWISSSLDGGTKSSLTVYEYDNYLDDARHKPLVGRTGITGHDPAYSVSFTLRGNVTGLTSYANAAQQTGPVTASTQYDVAGNGIATVDAREKTSTVGFADSFCNGTTCGGTFTPNTYAFPTSATSPIPDPTGQYASATAFSTTNIYDFWTGLVYSTTDANNQTTSFQYNDVLDRPTQARGAVGTAVTNQTTFQYNDEDRTITTTSDLNSNNDNLLVSEVLYDKMGRTIETRQYEGGTDYIAVKQIPFVMQQDPDTGAWVRATQSSNPYRFHLNEQPVWTTSFFDALDRLSKVRTPDNAIVRTSYSGHQVLVTDQTGKQRMSKTNALGQLTDVWEITSADDSTESVSFLNQAVAGYRTKYNYDTLGNLTNVTQQKGTTGSTQTRSFVYDSLKRLTSATNPESGTINYQYDNNGNLTQKTDARLIVTTYVYDALNRNTTVSYTNDPANTPAVARTYDGATNGKGRLWKTETLDANGSRTTIDSFDALGRPASQTQQFYANGNWSQSYTAQRTYDLAGHVLAQTYPSGHTVNYAYDSAGRTSSFGGNLGEGVTRTYANDFQYTEMGALQQEKFGSTTPIYHKQRYNQRGQMWDMRLSTVPFATDPTNGDRGSLLNYYSNNFVQGGNGADNNGNLLRQEINIPGSDFFQDSFSYDSLNRLKSVAEKLNGAGDTFMQAYLYDRWGNRTIDQETTTANVPHPEHTVDETNNRLNAPEGYIYEYDEAGNQTRDSTLGSQIGHRTFDAENRIIAARISKAGLLPWSYYTYDGDGRRVRRKLFSEIWQVYGFDGELLAEYPQTGPSFAVSQPQKEYGYRNGELLVTVEPFTNLAWNKPATQIDTLNLSTMAGKAVNGNVDGELGDGHASATNSHANSWWQVDLQGVQTIASITVWGRTDCCPEMTSNFYVFVSDSPFTSYDLNTTLNQPGVFNYLHSGYAALASIPVNRTGRYVRVQLSGTQSLVLAEVQVWSAAAKVNWLVTDQLGTPRMIVDKTGSLASVSRHDYLPFGEELFAGTGGRTTTQGYGAADGVRQKFTSKERDNETNLDFFEARYYGSTQGRFTSPDPMLSSGKPAEPQSWNRYAYVLNNPLVYVDPSGLIWGYQDGTNGNGERLRTFMWFEGDKVDEGYTAYNQSYFVSQNEVLWLDSGSSEHLRISKDRFSDAEFSSLGSTDPANFSQDQRSVLQRATADTVWASEGPRINFFASLAGGVAGGFGGALNFTFGAASRQASRLPPVLFHYTDEAGAAAIQTSQLGQTNRFLFLTKEGGLTPLQAQLELSLPQSNTARALFAVDTQALRGVNFVRSGRVTGNVFGRPGGGSEFMFPKGTTVPSSSFTGFRF
jgi:RHS repeat-associated protein